MWSSDNEHRPRCAICNMLKYIMRYQVHPCDDGRFFVLDTCTDLVMCYVGCELVAQKTARLMNASCENLDGYDYLDPTKLH